MIFENALGYLPEILAGSSYYEKNYEASIVNAFSLAVLQALNARNVPNPLSVIDAERFYGDTEDNPRHLRADLFVNISSMSVGSQELARFGWRYQNWLEAKFFRKIDGKATINSTSAKIGLAADIVRLCTLATPFVSYSPKESKRYFPDKRGQNSPDGKYQNLCTGRYLLHVYDRDPHNLLGDCTDKWKWLNNLYSYSPEIFTIKFVDKGKTKLLKRTFPEPIFNIEIQNIKIKNFIFEQCPKDGIEERLKCVLSKIISFKVVWGEYSWEEKEDRTAVANPLDSWLKIKDAVAKNIDFNSSTTKQNDDYPPTSDEQEKIRDESDSSSGELENEAYVNHSSAHY